MSTDATFYTTANRMYGCVLGTCDRFEEKRMGDEAFNVFTGCPCSLTSTMVLRRGTEQYIADCERSIIHESLMVAKRSLKSQSVMV